MLSRSHSTLTFSFRIFFFSFTWVNKNKSRWNEKVFWQKEAKCLLFSCCYLFLFEWKYLGIFSATGKTILMLVNIIFKLDNRAKKKKVFFPADASRTRIFPLRSTCFICCRNFLTAKKRVFFCVNLIWNGNRAWVGVESDSTSLYDDHDKENFLGFAFKLGQLGNLRFTCFPGHEVYRFVVVCIQKSLPTSCAQLHMPLKTVSAVRNRSSHENFNFPPFKRLFIATLGVFQSNLSILRWCMCRENA